MHNTQAQFHRDQIHLITQAAEDWRAKHDHGWELFSLFEAVQHCLSAAVSLCDSPQTGVDFLNAEYRTSVFDRVFELLRELHVNRRGSLDNSPPSGVFSLALCVHAAWLLDVDAREIASICDDEDCLQYFQLSPFWRDYCRGINAVANRKTYTPKEMKHKGYERHWATYLRLMADISTGKDTGPACALVDESFKQRNRDNRLIGDGLDGDGACPVKWDFRKHSLLKAEERWQTLGE